MLLGMGGEAAGGMGEGADGCARHCLFAKVACAKPVLTAHTMALADTYADLEGASRATLREPVGRSGGRGIPYVRIATQDGRSIKRPIRRTAQGRGGWPGQGALQYSTMYGRYAKCNCKVQKGITATYCNIRIQYIINLQYSSGYLGSRLWGRELVPMPAEAVARSRTHTGHCTYSSRTGVRGGRWAARGAAGLGLRFSSCAASSMFQHTHHTKLEHTVPPTPPVLLSCLWDRD